MIYLILAMMCLAVVLCISGKPHIIDIDELKNLSPDKRKTIYWSNV
jgi:hypothetical protein